MNCLANYSPPAKSQILVYVDDILIASESKEACKVAVLLKHLYKTGNKVNKQKLQWVKPQVDYLGHTLNCHGKQIQESRKQTIINVPQPVTKKQFMSFLGLCNYGRAWIAHYAEKTQPLLSLIHDTLMALYHKITWNKDAEKSFDILKQALVPTTTLVLPDYSELFLQTVDCKEGFMTSVLLQTHGNKPRPIAYHSKRLDPVAQPLRPCVSAVCAAAMAVTASADVVLYHSTELLVPHAVDVLLLQSKMSLLSAARHLSYTAILLSQPHIHNKQCTVLNPATLLPVNTDGEPHNCLEEAKQLQLPRPKLNGHTTHLRPAVVCRWFIFKDT